MPADVPVSGEFSLGVPHTRLIGSTLALIKGIQRQTIEYEWRGAQNKPRKGRVNPEAE